MTFNHLTKKRDRNSFSRSRFGSTWNRTHSNAHEFTGFTCASTGTLVYDVKGNQTSRPSTLSAPALNLDWNFDNQLRGADTNGSSGSLEVTFEYDALGRRVARSHSSGNVVYVHAGQQVIADYARGAVTSSPTYRYVYADYVDEPIVRHTGTATTLPTTGDDALYYHRNQQYSIIGLTNAAGTLVERYSYSAYGTLGIYDASGTVRMTSTYANRYTYTGREYDPDLNLYHFRARWYDPTTGGFISRDPLGYVDGMSLYRGYFGMRGIDPYGLCSDDDWWYFSTQGYCLLLICGACEGVGTGAVNIAGDVVGGVGELGCQAVDWGGSGCELVTQGYYRHNDWSATCKSLEGAHSEQIYDHFNQYIKGVVSCGISEQLKAGVDCYSGRITLEQCGRRIGTIGVFQCIGGWLGIRCAAPGRFRCGINETPLSPNAVCRARQIPILRECVRFAEIFKLEKRCIEGAQPPNSPSVYCGISGSKYFPDILFKPSGCTRTCAMSRAVEGAGPGCTVGHGGIIYRPGGLTWINNCGSCSKIIKANPDVIAGIGPKFCPRTVPETCGSVPVVPSIPWLPPQR